MKKKELLQRVRNKEGKKNFWKIKEWEITDKKEGINEKS